MPVLVDRAAGGCNILAGPDGPTASRHPKGAEWIEIGLLNNMPETALDGTEQRFLALLSAAAGDSWVHLRFFELPGVPRSDRARRRLAQSYLDLARVSDLDGLIVTGAEPKAAKLNEEPYWEAFTRLVDWAEQNTRSTIWSCLASHAAVLHLDGIERQPLRQKCSGVFDCSKAIDDWLTRDIPSSIKVSHSRLNELRASDLLARGYRVLTQSREAGVDIFTKRLRSHFVFFQGHPEYDPMSLSREYRRDVGRFLARERETYPAIPFGYFDFDTEQRLASFAGRAWCERTPALMAELPRPSIRPDNANGAMAKVIFRNWLHYLAGR